MSKRADLYGKAQVVVGDKTSHGGVVISGSTTNSWHGIPIARKTDRVYCPKCSPHMFEIAEGLSNCTDSASGLPMATDGHLTTCGAVLVAESADSSLLHQVLHFANQSGFNDRYVLRNSEGEPMPNTYYAVRKSNGEFSYGVTDGAGHTHLCLTGQESEEISFYIAG